MSQNRADAPREFREVLSSIAKADVRSDVRLAEVPAPNRIAPYAVALTGEVVSPDAGEASGRLVLMHDPAGQDAWEGTLRVIALVKAAVEPEVGADELWGQVAWSWIRDALHDVPHHALGGTVTKITDEAFGEIAEHGTQVRVEMRVSWTPESTDMAMHVRAWADLLGSCAGVPPLPDGVTMLRGSGK